MSRAYYMRAWRRARMDRTGERLVRGRFTTAPRRRRASREEPPHGTVARYYWSQGACRCRQCKDAVNAYHRGDTSWSGEPSAVSEAARSDEPQVGGA